MESKLGSSWRERPAREHNPDVSDMSSLDSAELYSVPTKESKQNKSIRQKPLQ